MTAEMNEAQGSGRESAPDGGVWLLSEAFPSVLGSLLTAPAHWKSLASETSSLWISFPILQVPCPNSNKP